MTLFFYDSVHCHRVLDDIQCGVYVSCPVGLCLCSSPFPFSDCPCLTESCLALVVVRMHTLSSCLVVDAAMPCQPMLVFAVIFLSPFTFISNTYVEKTDVSLVVAESSVFPRASTMTSEAR